MIFEESYTLHNGAAIPKLALGSALCPRLRRRRPAGSRRGTDPGEDKILQEAEGRAPVLIKKNAVLTGDGVFTWE